MNQSATICLIAFSLISIVHLSHTQTHNSNATEEWLNEEDILGLARKSLNSKLNSTLNQSRPSIWESVLARETSHSYQELHHICQHVAYYQLILSLTAAGDATITTVKGLMKDSLTPLCNIWAQVS